MFESHDPRAGNRSVAEVYSRDQIRARVVELGAAIQEDVESGDPLLLLGLLKGSFIFMADLVRAIRRPLEVDFLQVASYGSGTETSGTVQLIHDARASLKGRAVVIVEDIIDSGTTLRWLRPHLEARGPKRLDVCALLHKEKAVLEPPARWVGFQAPDEFLVGYGLDHAEAFRHLPYIGALKT
ncbi:MAG: hypoxanthine phosphoribosyltransferase [Gemmatimonadota bacterium]